MQNSPKKCIAYTVGNLSSPGPIYLLPGMVGQEDHDKRSGFRLNPAFSFGSRLRPQETSGSSPGPAFYNVNTKFKETGRIFSPEISLRGKLNDLDARNKNPSPVDYNIDRAMKASKTKPPIFSIGSKYEIPASKHNSPGPKYMLPNADVQSMYKGSPKYTLVGRAMDGQDNRSPGPANYSVKARNDTPKYTMAYKDDRLANLNNSPGPAAYFPDKPIYNNYQISFGEAHSQKKGILICEDDN